MTKDITPGETPRGVKTSEFWQTLIASILTLLVISGVLGEDLADAAREHIDAILLGLFGLIGLYTGSRAYAKQ